MRVVRDRGRRSRDAASRPRGARRSAAFGDDRLDPRAARRGPAPRRGPGAVRRPRPRRPPRRARLLAPAPPPEGPRGDAVARRSTRRPRRRLTDAALRLARAVGYESAGTCEFLLDRPRRVLLPRDEHPPPGRASRSPSWSPAATSSPTSSGSRPASRSGFEQARRPTPSGHAIEVRLYAEDAEAGFLPATGRDRGAALAGRRRDPRRRRHRRRRRDRRAGSTRCSPRSSPTAPTGARRSRRLTAALDETRRPRPDDEPALPALARPAAGGRPAARPGSTRSTAIWPPDDWRRRGPRSPTPRGRAAARLLGRRRLAAERPARRSGSSPTAMSERWRRAATRAASLTSRTRSRRSVPATSSTSTSPADRRLPRGAAAGRRSRGAGGGGSRRCRRPGRGRRADARLGRSRVHVAVGETVDAGDPIVTLEAMKMEHVVVAPAAGRVAEIGVAAGRPGGPRRRARGRSRPDRRRRGRATLAGEGERWANTTRTGTRTGSA